MVMDMVMDMVMERNKNNKPITRNVNNDEYLPVLMDIVNSGHDVSLLISGHSMVPFLVDKRDSIIISKPKGQFKKGQMVFYYRKNGTYIMHRIHHVANDDLYVVGDAQTYIEGPIKKDQVFGVIHKVRRKGKIISRGNFCWNFFEYVWIRVVPLRPFCLKLFSFVKYFR